MLLLQTPGRPHGRAATVFVCAVLILSALTAASPASAQFMKLGDIKGESTDEAHREWIDVLSWSHGVIIPIDPTTGLPTGARQHQPLRFTKHIDKATPLLAQALTEGASIPTATLAYDRPDPRGGSTPEFTMLLDNVLIVDLEQFIDRDSPLGPVFTEEVTLTYQRIRWTHEPTGAMHEDVWSGSGPSGFEIDLTPISTLYEMTPVYPNPSAGTATSYLTVADTQPVVADVYDVAGRLVERVFDGIIPGSVITRLETRRVLPAGTYFLAVRGAGFTTIRSFIAIP